VAADLKKGTYFVKELKISESDKGLSFTMTLRKELPGNKKALISLPTIEVKNSIVKVMDKVLEEAALYVGGKQSQLGIEFPEGEGGPAKVDPKDPVFLSKGTPKRVRTEKMQAV